MKDLWDEKPQVSTYPHLNYTADAMDAWLEKVKAELDKLEAIKTFKDKLQNDYAFATSSKGAHVIRKLKEILEDQTSTESTT